MTHPLDRLRHHVTGAIERGEREAVREMPAMKPDHSIKSMNGAGPGVLDLRKVLTQREVERSRRERIERLERAEDEAARRQAALTAEQRAERERQEHKHVQRTCFVISGLGFGYVNDEE